tara:strand:- start:1111 stop:1350 length:240 start_codon:yes stop_codon:yes gene_type:complete
MEKDLLKIIQRSFNIKNKTQLDSLKKRKFKISELKNYDSLNYMKFISEMEKKFQIKVDRYSLTKLDDYKSILNFIKLKK